MVLSGIHHSLNYFWFLGDDANPKVEIFVNQAVQCDGVGAFFVVHAELV